MALVKLFGAFAPLAGWKERRIEAETFGALKAAIMAESQELAARLDHASTAVILNHTITALRMREDGFLLGADDEIAFGPPMSGG